MDLNEALDFLQYGDWYNQVQEGISQAEHAKLGEAIAEVCDTLSAIKYRVSGE